MYLKDYSDSDSEIILETELSVLHRTLNKFTSSFTAPLSKLDILFQNSTNIYTDIYTHVDK